MEPCDRSWIEDDPKEDYEEGVSYWSARFKNFVEYLGILKKKGTKYWTKLLLYWWGRSVRFCSTNTRLESFWVELKLIVLTKADSYLSSLCLATVMINVFLINHRLRAFNWSTLLMLSIDITEPMDCLINMRNLANAAPSLLMFRSNDGMRVFQNSMASGYFLLLQGIFLSALLSENSSNFRSNFYRRTQVAP